VPVKHALPNLRVHAAVRCTSATGFQSDPRDDSTSSQPVGSHTGWQAPGIEPEVFRIHERAQQQTRVWHRQRRGLWRYPAGIESGTYRDAVLRVARIQGHGCFRTSQPETRDTVKRLLTDCDVYITDWVDVRNIPVADGGFDLESYIAHTRDFITQLLQDCGSLHVVAVCQPGPAVLSAIALLSETDGAEVPASMTLMGSPIDPRLSPTVPNKFAEEHSLAWFNTNMICTVPKLFAGAGRRVYPGFLQLTGFINMNPERHRDAWQRYYTDLVTGDQEAIEAHEYFYSEYNAVMDMSADFYLQTIDRVFHKAAIATGQMTFRHRPVDPAAITRTALMTIEGERDDISGVGQTYAAHDICTGLSDSQREHLLQPGAGHYGVFSGRRWRDQIAPKLLEFMRGHHPKH